MYRSLLLFILLVISIDAMCQESKTWEKGCYYDLKGNRFTGLIGMYYSDESASSGSQHYIWFKKSEQDIEQHKIAADTIKAYVIAADSFVVSHAPNMKRTPFLKVIADESVKLYESKFTMQPTMVVMGGTNMSTPMGTNTGKAYEETTYFYGNNPDELTQLRKGHFLDEMTKIFASQPALIEEIKYQDYTFDNIKEIIGHYYWYKRHELKAKGK